MKNDHNFVLCPRSNGSDFTPTQNHGVPVHLGIGLVVPIVGGTFMSILSPFGNPVSLRCVNVVEPNIRFNPFDVPIVFYEEINE